MERWPPPTTRPPVRWGLPDAVFAWLAGLGLSLFSVAWSDPDAGAAHQPAKFYVAAVVLQNLGIVVALAVISRTKGRGSLRDDFGFVEPGRELGPARALGWLVAGVVLSFAAGAILQPIVQIADLGGKPAQAISKTVERSTGLELMLLFLGVAIVAPVVEELLFRGALLRALLRRTSPPVAVFVSATIFAALHVVGDVGAGYVVPGLLLLGLVSGFEAVRTGNLARSVLLHVGFNLVSTLLLVL
jgi:membrane protease YdiL (CAAX protease family)